MRWWAWQGVGFGGPPAAGAPYFNVQGYSGLGDTYLATPMHAWDTVLEGRDTLSWQHGRHSWKAGGSYRRYIWPMWGFFQNRGYYQFTNGFTTQTLTNDGTGSGLASFLLGLPSVRQAQAGVPSMNLRHWSADAFLQDTWRISRDTTLEYGLRYEFMSALTDTFRQWANLMVDHCCPRQDRPVTRPAENTRLGGTPVDYLGGGLRFEVSPPVQVIPKPG
jgi:outer membrane receptor protein involved in Fe transport